MQDHVAYIVRVSVCKLALPERVSSGTHSTWVAGAELRRWDNAESHAAAIGL